MNHTIAHILPDAEAWANLPELLPMKLVSKIVGFSRSYIYQRIQAGLFPAPIRMDYKKSVWAKGEIYKWLVEVITRYPRGTTPHPWASRREK